MLGFLLMITTATKTWGPYFTDGTPKYFKIMENQGPYITMTSEFSIVHLLLVIVG